jgi:hypothetical protein
MARWYNVTGENSEIRITASKDGKTYLSNILEDEVDEELTGAVTITPYQIVTVGFES